MKYCDTLSYEISRGFLPLELNGPLIKHRRHKIRAVKKVNLGPYRDAALGEIEVFSARAADLLKFLGDGFVLQGFTRGRGLPEPVLRAADDGDAFEKRIRLLGADGIELAHALLAGKRIHRAKIRVQGVEQLVDLLVCQNALDFIERIDPKGKRNALASVDLL